MAGQKVAIITLTDPSDGPRLFHAFVYAFELKDNGFEVGLYLDGGAVKIIDSIEKGASNSIKPLYEKAMKEGMIKKACGYCANAFNVKSKIIQAKVSLTDDNEHVSLSGLIKDGYQIVTI